MQSTRCSYKKLSIWGTFLGASQLKLWYTFTIVGSCLLAEAVVAIITNLLVYEILRLLNLRLLESVNEFEVKYRIEEFNKLVQWNKIFYNPWHFQERIWSSARHCLCFLWFISCSTFITWLMSATTDHFLYKTYHEWHLNVLHCIRWEIRNPHKSFDSRLTGHVLLDEELMALIQMLTN